MLIGAHVSSSGGVANCIERATTLGIKYFQTFLSAPQSYKFPEYSDEKIAAFLEAKAGSDIVGCYAHAIYLLNFASEKNSLRFLSGQNLATTLTTSAKLKFNGVVVHLGSTKDPIENGITMVSNGIKDVLAGSDSSSTLLLENSAGSGNNIGSNFDHLVEIIDKNQGNPRLGVCLDTQHMFASGYNIHEDPHGVVTQVLAKFGDRIKCIHLNDSKTDFSSRKDRHDNIGQGKIGLEALKAFCTDPRLSHIPFILEVPGFEDKGPDAENIAIVRGFEQVKVNN